MKKTEVKKRIAIKIGSNVLTRSDGTLDVDRMADLVAQMATLRAQGIEIVLISSGAVASGRSEIQTVKKLDAVSSRQLYAAVGQAKLINRYFELFLERGILCGQVLTTTENFGSRTHYLNQKNCIETMLEAGVIPIINENDAVSVTELMFTDNDELSGLVAAMLNVDALILLSNVDGLYNGDPRNSHSRVIRKIDGKVGPAVRILPGTSAFGRGGMATKYNIARKVAEEGIRVIIANGLKNNILVNLENRARTVATHFLPAKKPASGVKKWIAHSQNAAKGQIYVDAGVEAALAGPRAASILFVGVTNLSGNFKRNDIVLILNAKGKQLGLGRAEYDSEKARTLIGKRNAKPIVHYNYLHLDNEPDNGKNPESPAQLDPDITTHCDSQIQQTAEAAEALAAYNDNRIQKTLNDAANMLITKQKEILEANKQDLARMSPADPKYDRLKLDDKRIETIAGEMKRVAALPSPVGTVLSKKTLPNGMKLKKIAVPFGVVGVIFEARPNVTCDVFALCLKSGNACLLKGGSDAEKSNRILVEILREALQQNRLNPNLCTLLPSGRKATETLLRAAGSVDLLIPRGSAALIDYVRQQASVPVIETGAGVCHCYFDRTGDLEIGQNILFNAKTRRVSVCNALDCLIIHCTRLSDLPRLCSRLAERSVILYADRPACAALDGHYPKHLLQPARSENFGHEFLDYKMSIRTVRSINEALAHIARHGSHHSESIVSCSPSALRRFTQGVDAACIYLNLPTSFSDGAQFGFGAEIGISTQKLHARGPMALPELTTYKYVISGKGQTRED